MKRDYAPADCTSHPGGEGAWCWFKRKSDGSCGWEHEAMGEGKDTKRARVPNKLFRKLLEIERTLEGYIPGSEDEEISRVGICGSGFKTRLQAEYALIALIKVDKEVSKLFNY